MKVIRESSADGIEIRVSKRFERTLGDFEITIEVMVNGKRVPPGPAWVYLTLPLSDFIGAPLDD